MRRKVKNPHNNFFIRQFQKNEFARSFFKSFLPEAVEKRIQWETLRVVPAEFVQKALKERKGDILYEVVIGEKKAAFYIHLEHQRKADPAMTVRMVIYIALFWDQYLREAKGNHKQVPMIFPMVLYQGRKPWRYPTSLHETLQVPDFRFDLVDLSQIPDAKLKSEMVQHGISLMVMKHIDNEDMTAFFFEEIIPLLRRLAGKKTGLEYVEEILYYLFNAAKHLDKDTIIEDLDDKLEPTEIREKIMTVAEQLIQEGFNKGNEEGYNKGKLEGEALILQKLIKLKFGIYSKELDERLQNSTPDDLERMAERILSANKVENLFQ